MKRVSGSIKSDVFATSGKGKVDLVEISPFPLFWVVLAALGAHLQIWSALPGVGMEMQSTGSKNAEHRVEKTH